MSGISNEDLEKHHTGYIQNWISALKNDKTLAVSAAQRAQKASDLILNRKFETTENE